MEDAARKEAPHIVLYIGSLQKGGAERVMGNLAEYFYAQGMRVTLVTTYFHPPEYVLPHGAWDPVTGEPLENESGIRRVYSDPPADLLTGTPFTGSDPFLFRQEQPDGGRDRERFEAYNYR